MLVLSSVDLNKKKQKSYRNPSVKQLNSRSVSPDLGPNCLPRLSADDKSHHYQEKCYLFAPWEIFHVLFILSTADFFQNHFFQKLSGVQSECQTD